MGSKLSRMLAAAAVACAALALAIPAAQAQSQVTLRSEDGATQVSGELLEFDGTTYTLRTGVGTITIEASRVSCEGEGCPAGSEAAPGETPGETTGETPGETAGEAPGEAAEPVRRFAVVGSNVIGEALMPPLAEGYADSLGARLVREVGTAPNEQVLRVIDEADSEIAAVELRAHGTAAAFAALAEGRAAIGLASRRMQEREGEPGAPGSEPGALGDLRDTENERVLALDGLILIVHPDNPVAALTLDQAAALVAGRIGSWAQLGGPDEPVSLYVPPDGSGTLEVFVDRVMRPRGLSVAAAAERIDDNADLSDLVSIDPGGLGVTAVAFARAAKPLAIRQQCGLLSRPTSFAIKSEEYPLARRLYAYTAGGAVPAQARALLDFALSDAAQPIIAEAGFVDRGIESQGIDVQGLRLAHSLTSPEEFSLPLFREMLNELKEARRLSVTFRFNRGSTDLETRSQREAERLARRLAAGAHADSEILLVGFADSVGEFEVNRGLAERRADAVLEALTAAVPEGALADVPIQVRSYGELTPVGCNETGEGRELNRRVEVWVRDRR